jgi:hypothetical protein
MPLSGSSLAQFTGKIRTIYGPEPAISASKLTFALVRAMRTVYHQQTKNLLVHNIRSGHQGLPAKAPLFSCLVSTRQSRDAQAPRPIGPTISAPKRPSMRRALRWQLTAQGTIEVRPQAAAND